MSKLLYNPVTINAVVKTAKIFDGPGTPSEKISSEVIHKRYQYLDVESYPFKVPVSYYLRKTKSKNLVIFFHGLLSSEQTWDYPDMFSTKHWLDMRVKLKEEPNALCLSFGWCWLLYPESYERKMYPQYATTEVVGEILGKILEEHNISNLDMFLIGSSMGGFNAIQFFLDNQEDFKKAIFHVPMTPTCDVFNWFDMNCLSAPIVRGHFDKASWLYCNPHMLVENVDKKGDCKIQFQVSKRDQFKLYTGGKILAQKFINKGYNAELIENEGDHNDLNYVKAADFLNL